MGTWVLNNHKYVKVNGPYSGTIHDQLVLSTHSSTQSLQHNRYSPSNFSAYLTQIGTFKLSDQGMAKCMFDGTYGTIRLRMCGKTEGEKGSTCISLPLIRRNSGLERILQLSFRLNPHNIFKAYQKASTANPNLLPRSDGNNHLLLLQHSRHALLVLDKSLWFPPSLLLLRRMSPHWTKLINSSSVFLTIKHGVTGEPFLRGC